MAIPAPSAEAGAPRTSCSLGRSVRACVNECIPLAHPCDVVCTSASWQLTQSSKARQPHPEGGVRTMTALQPRLRAPACLVRARVRAVGGGAAGRGGGAVPCCGPPPPGAGHPEPAAVSGHAACGGGGGHRAGGYRRVDKGWSGSKGRHACGDVASARAGCAAAPTLAGCTLQALSSSLAHL